MDRPRLVTCPRLAVKRRLAGHGDQLRIYTWAGEMEDWLSEWHRHSAAPAEVRVRGPRAVGDRRRTRFVWILGYGEGGGPGDAAY